MHDQSKITDSELLAIVGLALENLSTSTPGLELSKEVSAQLAEKFTAAWDRLEGPASVGHTELLSQYRLHHEALMALGQGDRKHEGAARNCARHGSMFAGKTRHKEKVDTKQQDALKPPSGGSK